MGIRLKEAPIESSHSKNSTDKLMGTGGSGGRESAVVSSFSSEPKAVSCKNPPGRKAEDMTTAIMQTAKVMKTDERRLRRMTVF
jgi:hypothetical protein